MEETKQDIKTFHYSMLNLGPETHVELFER